MWYAAMNESDITACVNILLILFKSAITADFSSILISYNRFFTGVALGDVDCCFSFMFFKKSQYMSHVMYHQCNKPIHVTDGMTVMPFLLASYRR